MLSCCKILHAVITLAPTAPVGVLVYKYIWMFIYLIKAKGPEATYIAVQLQNMNNMHGY